MNKIIQVTKADWDNAEQLTEQMVAHRVACRAHGAPPNVVGVIAPYLAGHRAEAVEQLRTENAALTQSLAESRAEVERLRTQFVEAHELLSASFEREKSLRAQVVALNRENDKLREIAIQGTRT